MTTTRKRIYPSFKQGAVNVAEKSDKPEMQIEKDLGIYQGARRHWRKELELKGNGVFTGSSTEDALENEPRRVKKERDNARVPCPCVKINIFVTLRERLIVWVE